jgi:hypothetical protein
MVLQGHMPKLASIAADTAIGLAVKENAASQADANSEMDEGLNPAR